MRRHPFLKSRSAWMDYDEETHQNYKQIPQPCARYAIDEGRAAAKHWGQEAENKEYTEDSDPCRRTRPPCRQCVGRFRASLWATKGTLCTVGRTSSCVCDESFFGWQCRTSTGCNISLTVVLVLSFEDAGLSVAIGMEICTFPPGHTGQSTLAASGQRLGGYDFMFQREQSTTGPRLKEDPKHHGIDGVVAGAEMAGAGGRKRSIGLSDPFPTDKDNPIVLA